jgi:hypothetical protein
MVELGGKHVPVLQRDLEHLYVMHLRDPHEDDVGLEKHRVQFLFFNKWQVVLEEREEKERQVVDEVLVTLRAVIVRVCNICI